MWGDMYIKTQQCWSHSWIKTPDANWMHDKAHDEQLMDSMAGLVRDRTVYTY